MSSASYIQVELAQEGELAVEPEEGGSEAGSEDGKREEPDKRRICSAST